MHTSGELNKAQTDLDLFFYLVEGVDRNYTDRRVSKKSLFQSCDLVALCPTAEIQIAVALLNWNPHAELLVLYGCDSNNANIQSELVDWVDGKHDSRSRLVQMDYVYLTAFRIPPDWNGTHQSLLNVWMESIVLLLEHSASEQFIYAITSRTITLRLINVAVDVGLDGEALSQSHSSLPMINRIKYVSFKCQA